MSDPTTNDPGSATVSTLEPVTRPPLAYRCASSTGNAPERMDSMKSTPYFCTVATGCTNSPAVSMAGMLSALSCGDQPGTSPPVASPNRLNANGIAPTICGVATAEDTAL